LDLRRHVSRWLSGPRGRSPSGRRGGRHRGLDNRRTPRGDPGACLGCLGMRGAGASRLGLCRVGASEGEQRDDHSRRDPHRDSRRGDRHSGIGPDAVPAHPPDRLREHWGPGRFRTPDHPSSVCRRILRGGRAAAHDPLPQFRRKRGKRQQTRKNRRAQRASRLINAGLALLDMPRDQVARLLAQLPVPVGQQFPHHRAGLPPGKRGAKRTQRFL